ncbi:MAG: type I-MYXAN CRISPR-associated protein Cas6/Cmx6 [Sulfuriferula sp.]
MVTDIVFGVSARAVPADHGRALLLQLCEHLAWLEAEVRVGIHSIRGSLAGTGELLLNRRAKLVMRVPMQRVSDTLELSGKSLELGGDVLIVGPGKIKPLVAYSPLYASCVVTGSEGEAAFAADVIRLLGDMGIDTRFICGKRRTVETVAGKQSGYSLLLHGLPLEHAIRVQEIGLGNGRKTGCGIFVPHKAISALE